MSATTVRHWLQRHELKTQPAHYARRDGPAAREVAARVHHATVGVRSCRVGAAGGYPLRALQHAGACTDRRRRVKAILVAEAGGAASRAGSTRTLGALQFHHLDPATKAFDVSRQGVTRSLERLRLEARKCVLLCANCHAMVEAGLLICPRRYYADNLRVVDAAFRSGVAQSAEHRTVNPKGCGFESHPPS